jgi:NAD+ synthase
LIDKVPTADLEDGAPLRPDEDVFGVSYDQIDDFLEGKQVGETAVRTIVAAYRATSHKRALPVTPSSA